MRVSFWSTSAILIALLSNAAPVRAQQKTEAGQADCPQNWPTDNLNLSGRLGETEIRAYLHGGYPADTTPGGISGVVLLPGHWTPGTSDDSAAFSLAGAITGCQLRLADSNGGIWRVRFTTSQQVQGTREHGGASVPVSLQLASIVDCSGGGPWRRFESPLWPISFDYPESWRLGQAGNIVTIECPDAANLAWGGSAITLQLGHGAAAVVTDDGRRGRRIDRFVTFEKNEWLIGHSCDEPDAVQSTSCSPARRSAWRGMTVLQGAAGEHRQYRPGGGYVGKGGGIMNYLFLRDDAWVSLRSKDTPESLDSLSAPGPVIFDGTGVTERLVRSIRVR